MKIYNKRNQMKQKFQMQKQAKLTAHSIYSTPHGPYKCVSLLSLTPNSSLVLFSSLSTLYYYERLRTNFLFKVIDTPDLDSSYLSRASDVVVFCVNDYEINHAWIIKQFCPTVVFCILDSKYKQVTKNFVAKNFPKSKIAEAKQLLDTLSVIKIKNTSVCDRPYMVPANFYMDIGSSQFVMEGYMKKGLISSSVILNGKFDCDVLEVEVEGSKYTGADIDSFVKEIEGYEDCNVENMELETDDKIDIYGEHTSNEEQALSICDGDLNSDERSCDEISSSCDRFSSDEEIVDFERFRGYKGIRNFKTFDFSNETYPTHYSSLVFFNSPSRLTKFLKSLQSPFKDHSYVKLRLQCSTVITEEIRVMFNTYKVESKNTVLNYHFSTFAPLHTYKNLGSKQEDNDQCDNASEESLVHRTYILDLGYKIIQANLLLTNNSNSLVYKAQNMLSSGVLSFIGPYSVYLNRLIILDEVGNILGTASNGFIHDRVIFDEKVLQGRPIKVNKRCAVIRKMFSSKDEVSYFKNIRLYTKRGVNGFIKKAIGMYGTFKAYFSQPLRNGEAVRMSLYKRLYFD